jgi:hypothetical protein
MNQWEIGMPSEDSPAIMEGEEVVMYFDTVNPDVMAKVVELYNAGKPTEDIEAYLLNEDNCDKDQREFIMEQIHAYIKLKNVSDQPVVQPAATNEGNGTNAIIAAPGTQPIPELTKGQRAAATRKANQLAAKKTTPAKKTDTVGVIKSLEEKIQLVRVLDATEVPEIPSGISKEARELMVAFQKENEVLVQKYMDKIQKL